MEHKVNSSTGPSLRTPRFLGVSLEISPGFIFNLVALWTGMAWYMGVKHPDWDVFKRISGGALSALALIAADVGHAFAHIFSARAGGVPMDQIKLSSGMPRTVYFDQNVPPRAHILRALGGPLYSTLGFATSLALGSLLLRKSFTREVVSWSSIGHGLILAGSLAPLPIVDGGSILKWTLVENGQTHQAADRVVEKSSIATGIAAGVAGAGFAAQRRWIPAAGLLAAGIIAVAAAKGKIR